MKLFKYRDLRGDGLRFALDAIVHNRIYLATRDQVNDPFEGRWSLGDVRPMDAPINDQQLHRKVREIIDSTRFASFSTTAVIPLLWAHYAGGYSGICLEYDIPDDDQYHHLTRIEYDLVGDPFLSVESMKSIVAGKTAVFDHGVLKRKRKEWAYEEEWRVIRRPLPDGHLASPFMNGITPLSAIFGVTQGVNDPIAKKVCEAFGIKVGYLNPNGDDSGFEIVY